MPQFAGKINQTLPVANAEGSTNVIFRQGRYGEMMMIPLTTGLYALADEGTYYRATNQVPGTATAYSIQTGFSATIAYLIMRNTDTAGGKRIYMDYIRLICTTVPASATSGHFAIAVDPTNRYTSGGTPLTGQNPNTAFGNNSIASCIIGTPTIAAAGANVKYVSRAVIFGAIPVVQSEFLIVFGSQETAAGTLGGTTAVRAGIPVGPGILAPGGNHSLLLHLWFPANAVTAPQFEFEAGWWER